MYKFTCEQINRPSEKYLFFIKESQHNVKASLVIWHCDAGCRSVKKQNTLLLENKKQNIFALENNLESTRVP